MLNFTQIYECSFTKHGSSTYIESVLGKKDNTLDTGKDVQDVLHNQCVTVLGFCPKLWSYKNAYF